MNVIINLSILFGIGLFAALFCFVISVYVEKAGNRFSDFIQTHFG